MSQRPRDSEWDRRRRSLHLADDVRAVVALEISRSGMRQGAWARAHGLTETTLSGFLTGYRDAPEPKLLRLLGLEPLVVYRPIPEIATSEATRIRSVWKQGASAP